MWTSDKQSNIDNAHPQQQQQQQQQQQTTQHCSTAAIYTSIAGQTATIIPASAIQSGLAAAGTTTVHLQPHAQIVHHGGNTYLVQSAGKIEEDIPNFSHTTKASPITVQWLCDNYETADGVSLPRSTLYNHYLQHCQQEKLEPMNQASFGKLIRSVFYGLRTRRLGTRGNSKYHYYGIRIKPSSPLNHYVEDHTFAMRQYPSFHRQSEYHWRSKYLSNGVSYGSNNLGNNAIGIGGSTTHNSGIIGNINSSGNPLIAGSNTFGSTALSGGAKSEPSGPQHQYHGQQQHSNYLGESASALPNLGDIVARAELDTLSEEECATEGVTLDDINVFCQMYYDHSDSVLSAVVYLNFKYIETLWQDFWRTSVKPQNMQWEDKLPKVKLLRLLKLPQIHRFLQLFDNVFYQSLVEVLIPNVLRPIPSALTQNIRHFAKSLEGWMAAATAGLPQTVVRIKMSCVCALAQTLRRHTSLNHLAQAARAVLKNASQINQMLSDLNRVDFGNVQEQASWVCGCDGRRVDNLQQDFKRILQQQSCLEEWAEWLERVVSEVLEPHQNSPRFPAAAHQFILRWSFYSSLVIRDLTLRSAASFGSFHLIRLLYDEYIYYLVEQKVALHLKLTPVAVTGDMGRQLMAGGTELGGESLEQLHLQMDMDQDRKDRICRGDSKLGANIGEDINGSQTQLVLISASGDEMVGIGSTGSGCQQQLDSEKGPINVDSSDASNNSGTGNSSVNDLSNNLGTATQAISSGITNFVTEIDLTNPSIPISNNANITSTASIVTGTINSSTLSTSTIVKNANISTSTKLEPSRPTSLIGGGVRKTVNVTTFGDPLPTMSTNSHQSLTKTVTLTMSNSSGIKVEPPQTTSSISVPQTHSFHQSSGNSTITNLAVPNKRIKLFNSSAIVPSVSNNNNNNNSNITSSNSNAGNGNTNISTSSSVSNNY